MDQNKVFYDTDCLSCFLWVHNEYLPRKVFPNYDFLVPHSVEKEIERTQDVFGPNNKCLNNFHLGKANDDFKVLPELDVSDYDQYEMFTRLITDGVKVGTYKGPMIGDGEAECIVHAKFEGGIIASNNLRDIGNYCNELNLEYITTADILLVACLKNCCTFNECEQIWDDMIKAGREKSLPSKTFKEYFDREKDSDKTKELIIKSKN